MTIQNDILTANALLPGVPTERDDVRWQALIAIGEHIETDPEPIWQFVLQWGGSPDEDLRDAVACLLLEPLLEYHFALIFPRVEPAAKADPLFADMFCRCWKFGQSEEPLHAQQFDALQQWCGRLEL